MGEMQYLIGKGNKMATYHGLVKLTCLVCDWQTTDDNTITTYNDLDGNCPNCENQFFRWENQDGSIVVSLEDWKDNIKSYDNLVFQGGK
jgi:hypothetical protein